MASLFNITTATSRVRLDKEGRGEASFTVSNASGRTIDGRALLVAEDEAVKAWLSLVGEAEREFAEAETHQYTVEVAAPPEALAGDYDIGLDMVETENPDENYTKGPTVTVEVPEPEPEPEEPGWPFPWPWWYILVGVLVVVVVIVVLILLL